MGRTYSDVLQARAAAKGQFTTMLLGLGAVALLVGAIGIANILYADTAAQTGSVQAAAILHGLITPYADQFVWNGGVSFWTRAYVLRSELGWAEALGERGEPDRAREHAARARALT